MLPASEAPDTGWEKNNRALLSQESHDAQVGTGLAVVPRGLPGSVGSLRPDYLGTGPGPIAVCRLASQPLPTEMPLSLGWPRLRRARKLAGECEQPERKMHQQSSSSQELPLGLHLQNLGRNLLAL